jgi:hypothetical protein
VSENRIQPVWGGAPGRDPGRKRAFFREVNERIRELHPGGALVDFVCECNDESCADLVPLSLDEYSEVRSVATSFLVAPAHERLGDGQIVGRYERYLVVEGVGTS